MKLTGTPFQAAANDFKKFLVEDEEKFPILKQVNIVMDNEGRRSGDVYVVLEDADVAYACLEKDKQCMAGFGTRYRQF